LLHKGTGTSWSRFNRQSNLRAENAYRAALEIEPENGRALAFLATSLAMKISNGWSDNIAADSYAAWTMGKKGVDALPEDPLVLASYGHIHTCLGQACDGVLYLTRSLELDPNSAWSMGLLALALTCSGRARDAISQVTAALRLSPRDEATHWFLAILSWAYLQQEFYDDAAREAQRSVNAYPGWAPPWATLAVARAALGQLADGRDAIAACKKVDERVTRHGFERYFDYVIRDEQHRQQIRTLLKQVWPD
jgi:tetratricopeptide (TPR) repeat protein